MSSTIYFHEGLSIIASCIKVRRRDQGEKKGTGEQGERGKGRSDQKGTGHTGDALLRGAQCPFGEVGVT